MDTLKQDMEQLKSIETILDEPWFHEKPWLICGTGESLERFKPELREKFNIWCVYYSIDVTGWADVFHFQDVHQEADYRAPTGFPTPYRHCAVRHPVALRHIYSREVLVPPRALVISYSTDIEMGGGDPPGKIFPTSNSTSFAFMFLCEHSKFPEIHTLGIDDGSEGIARGVNELYIKNTNACQEQFIAIHGKLSWDLENASNQGWCDMHGKKWVRL